MEIHSSCWLRDQREDSELVSRESMAECRQLLFAAEPNTDGDYHCTNPSVGICTFGVDSDDNRTFVVKSFRPPNTKVEELLKITITTRRVPITGGSLPTVLLVGIVRLIWNSNHIRRIPVHSGVTRTITVRRLSRFYNPSRSGR